MTDYSFPLPPKNLHARYDPVFSAFKKGQSVTLIGLPQSARSGYLKFILEYDSTFLAEFIDPKTYHFIYIDDPSVTADNLIHIIAAKILAINLFTPKVSASLDHRLRIHDPHLTLVALQSALNTLYPSHKFIIILYQTEKLLDTNPQTIAFLKTLWDTNRNQPNSQINLCFIGSPILLDLKNQPSWSALRPALEETTVTFPLFSPAELAYLRHRIESLSGTKIPQPIHQLAANLSAGHTVLYRLLSHLSETELRTISYTHHHPAITALLAEIWSSFPNLVKQNWHQDYQFYLPLLPPSSQNLEPAITGSSIPLLTAQQKLLFTHFVTHPGQIIKRDDIAQVLWGTFWNQKYSDWAIDRIIYQLRKKLLGTKFSLLTIKNRGYLFQE